MAMKRTGARIVNNTVPPALRKLGLGHEIAGIGRIGIASVAVVGFGRIGDHVVAGKQASTGGDAQASME